MNRFLVIVIGHGYVYPSFICVRDLAFLRDRLCEESKHNNFIYIVFNYYDRKDLFIPCCYVTKGDFFNKDNCLFPRVRYDG